MSRLWRIVLTVVGLLLIAGIVLGGAGWITGASIGRMVELVFGGQESLEITINVLRQELAALLG